MKKGWQQTLLYLIALTSYGCISDKDKVSARLKMVTTFPMVYFLKDGTYVERWPYQKPMAESRKRMTVLTADKQYIGWGSFRQTEMQEEKVILTNTGTDTLYISAIESSCECTTVTMDGFSCSTRRVYYSDDSFSSGRRGGI